MHFKVFLYLLFCVQCGAKSHGVPHRGGGPPGDSGPPSNPQPGGPQDGLPGAQDANPALSNNS